MLSNVDHRGPEVLKVFDISARKMIFGKVKWPVCFCFDYEYKEGRCSLFAHFVAILNPFFSSQLCKFPPGWS